MVNALTSSLVRNREQNVMSDFRCDVLFGKVERQFDTTSDSRSSQEFFRKTCQIFRQGGDGIIIRIYRPNQSVQGCDHQLSFVSNQLPALTARLKGQSLS